MEPVMGVYRLHKVQDGQSFVGFTRNLTGTKKRLLFELKLNACSYKPLQAFYNEADGAVDFEVLETYAPPAGASDEEIDAYLQLHMLEQKGRLNAKLVQVEVY